MNGYIYVLHFDEKLAHAQHYVGSSLAPLARASRHATGDGARLTEVLAEQGKTWKIAAVYQLTERCPLTLRQVEKLAKSRHGGQPFCPICNFGQPVDNPPRWTQQIPVPQLSSTEVVSYEKNRRTVHGR